MDHLAGRLGALLDLVGDHFGHALLALYAAVAVAGLLLGVVAALGWL